MKKRWIAAALLLASGAHAADIPVSTPAGLRSALQDAKSGDRIFVAPGDYGALVLRDSRFAPPLVIAAAEGARPPVFASIALTDVGGVVLSGLKVSYGRTDAPLSSYAVSIRRGSDIVLSGLDVSSAENGIAGDDAYAINIRDSARITVEGGSMHDVYRAVAIFDSDDIEVAGNAIRRVGSDGVVARGTVGLSILENDFADFAIIDLDVQHPDAIQLWSRGAKRANEDVVIRGNSIRRGVGDPSQGIFIKSPEISTRRLLIEENFVEQSMAQGIFVENGEGVVIRNNTVVAARTGDRPGIEVRAPSADALVVDNIAAAFRMAPGVEAARNR